MELTNYIRNKYTKTNFYHSRRTKRAKALAKLAYPQYPGISVNVDVAPSTSGRRAVLWRGSISSPAYMYNMGVVLRTEAFESRVDAFDALERVLRFRIRERELGNVEDRENGERRERKGWRGVIHRGWGWGSAV